MLTSVSDRTTDSSPTSRARTLVTAKQIDTCAVIHTQLTVHGTFVDIYNQQMAPLNHLNNAF